MDQEAEMIELLNDWKYVWNHQLRLAYIFRLSCRILKEMSDSEGDDAPERVAKNCLKLLLDSTNSLVSDALLLKQMSKKQTGFVLVLNQNKSDLFFYDWKLKQIKLIYFLKMKTKTNQTAFSFWH